jgi:hypothetical protein
MVSAIARRSAASRAMSAKFSGNTATRAPDDAASANNRRAVSTLAPASVPEVI